MDESTEKCNCVSFFCAGLTFAGVFLTKTFALVFMEDEKPRARLFLGGSPPLHGEDDAWRLLR